MKIHQAVIIPMCAGYDRNGNPKNAVEIIVTTDNSRFKATYSYTHISNVVDDVLEQNGYVAVSDNFNFILVDDKSITSKEYTYQKQTATRHYN